MPFLAFLQNEGQQLVQVSKIPGLVLTLQAVGRGLEVGHVLLVQAHQGLKVAAP